VEEQASALDLLAFIWVIGFVAPCMQTLLAALTCATRRLGASGISQPKALESTEMLCPPSQQNLVAPHVAMNLPGLFVLFKPPGWEVDTTADVGRGPWISESLRALAKANLSASFLSSAAWDYGVIHRLDTPCSGLLLIGNALGSFLFLKAQLGCAGILRDYLVLGNGMVLESAGSSPIVQPGGAQDGRTRSFAVQGGGKPAKSSLISLGGTRCWHRQVHLLIGIRVTTGRRHQIRAHLSAAACPPAADAKYSEGCVLIFR